MKKEIDAINLCMEGIKEENNIVKNVDELSKVYNNSGNNHEKDIIDLLSLVNKKNVTIEKIEIMLNDKLDSIRHNETLACPFKEIEEIIIDSMDNINSYVETIQETNNKLESVENWKLYNTL